MADIFAAAWMQKLKDEWNKDVDFVKELANIGFTATIAYGFEHEDEPRAVLVIEKGKAVSAAPYDSQDYDWDLRANRDNWLKWLNKPPGMMALGMAYTSKSLTFRKGDYTAMIKDPRMAGPFVKSFIVMGRV